jgi:hypothetical protein
MVNRKSRNAFFLEHGSPLKQLREQVKNAPTKKKKNVAKKKKRGTKVTWEGSAKEYFEGLKTKRSKRN